MPTTAAPTEVSPPAIPAQEFKDRLSRAQQLVREAGLDAMLVNSDEADFANVRYFSDYWTLFERAGVLIPAEGEPALLIGPESEAYAVDRSRIPNIHKMVEYRESADPAYPGVEVSTFEQVFADVGVSNPKRIGIGGYLITTAPVLASLQQAFPQADAERADQLMVALRSIKSEAEIACLKHASAISEKAVGTVLDQIAPGMTEQQVVGIAQKAMYENGAEYEGHPTYILSGGSTRHAISRPTPKVLQAGELVQLNIGARVAGYSSSVGLPISLGTMTDEMRDLVSFGLEAHQQTMDNMQPGKPAADIAKEYHQFFVDRGYADNFLYGPCHGLGMLEVEQPWLEDFSDYQLQPNMCFQIDTFATGKSFGLRWENGGRVTDTGFELFSGKYREVIELT